MCMEPQTIAHVHKQAQSQNHKLAAQIQGRLGYTIILTYMYYIIEQTLAQLVWGLLIVSKMRFGISLVVLALGYLIKKARV